MEATLKIGGKEIRVRSSADLPRMYRREFNSDIFIELCKFEHMMETDPEAAFGSYDTVSMFENLAYCMAKSADPLITEDIEEWLGQFDGAMDILNAIPQILAIWRNESHSTSKLKKKEGK